MDSVSTLHCVKTHTDNRRTYKPTLDAFQIFTTGIKVVTKSYSALEVSKHLELQWINVSQHKCFLRAQYTVWRPVWITWGPLNILGCNTNVIPVMVHGKKHLELQWINVSQHEWFLWVHYTVSRSVWITGGLPNHLWMQTNVIPVMVHG
jgi:hypothetical protein